MHKWIKLYVALAENEIIRDQSAFVVFMFVLMTANRKGESIVSRLMTSTQLGMKPSTFRDSLERVIVKYDMATAHATGKYTIVSVKNWKKYQSMPDSFTNISPTFHRHSTDTNIEKSKSKSKKGNKFPLTNERRELPRKIDLSNTPEYQKLMKSVTRGVIRA